MLKDNDGKIPPEYKGKYERSLPSGGRRPPSSPGVRAVMPTAAQTPDQEHAETLEATNDMCWALVREGPPAATAPPATKSPCCPTQWDPFNQDADKEEENMCNTLQAAIQKFQSGITASANAKPRSCLKKAPLSPAQIASIAKDVKSGKIKLPDLDLETNQDWIALWAILDSGSSINGIDVEKYIPKTKLRESSAQRKGQTYKAANGGILKNEGETDVQVKMQEGHIDNVTWQNVKLDMPILSTARVADNNGGPAKKILYESDGGNVIRADGSTNAFIRHGDVYFQKIYIPKRLTEDAPGFARPGVSA